MSQDSENFDKLRVLLTVKRHEQPPPGYFDRFSRDVMARIKAGESGGSIGCEFSWFHRFLSMFDMKPVFAGAFGTAVCAFLISGVLSSEQTPAVGSSITPTSVTPTMAAVVPVSANSSTMAAPFDTSSNSASGSLFDQFQTETRQVSDRFYLPNN
jgi:hypothetical protein